MFLFEKNLQFRLARLAKKKNNKRTHLIFGKLFVDTLSRLNKRLKYFFPDHRFQTSFFLNFNNYGLKKNNKRKTRFIKNRRNN